MIEAISNPSAERAILNLCMKNTDNLIECSASNLFSDHFAVKANGYIYTAICYLTEGEGVKRIDSNLIYTILSTNATAIEEVDKLGGMVYIQNLSEFVVADNIKVYTKQIKEYYTKRMIYKLGEDIKKEATEEKTSEEILNESQKRLLSLMLDANTEESVYKVGSSVLERLKAREENPRDVFGYQIGWASFDYYSQGFQNNDLMVLVAESKVGKSTMLENMAAILSVQSGLKGLYIDTEVTDEEFEDRMIAMLSGIPFEEIRNGKYIVDTIYGLGREKKAKVYEATAKMNNSSIFHAYLPNFTIENVSALIRKYKIQHGIEYCVFDYIKLPNEEVKGLNNAQEYQRLGYFTTCLKDMAGICQIPILTACQSNRTSIGDTDPDAGNIGGSYRILQLATKLYFLRNKTEQEMIAENFTRGNQKLHIKYQRNGTSDKTVDIQFDKPILRMQEVDSGKVA